jgi:hypothetical protein
MFQRIHILSVGRRTAAVNELIQTEMGYIAELDCLIQYYVQPLRDNSVSNESFISPSDVDEVFLFLSLLIEIGVIDFKPDIFYNCGNP